MKEVTFFDWVFIVDYEKTLESYQNAKQGGSSDCACGDCKRFLTIQDQIFPSKVRDLFIECGIDYKKDEDITTISDFADGKSLITIYFDLFGEIKKIGSENKTILGDFKLLQCETGRSSNIFKTSDGIVKLIFETYVETYFTG